jgi:hypothetical protein
MECTPSSGQYTDIVINVGWICDGVEQSSSSYFYGNAVGSSSFPMPEGSFTPYDQLTQEQVLGWCWANGVNKTATETAINSNINLQINPLVTQPTLPWI